MKPNPIQPTSTRVFRNASSKRTSLFAFYSVIALSLSAFSPTGDARDFTNNAGRTIQADLVGVEGSGDSMVAELKLANGQTAKVPVSDLSEADRTFVAEYATEQGESGAPKKSEASNSASPGTSVFADPLDGKLVAVEGKRVDKFEPEGEPEMYAFYFSAHWCPPCRAFTPKLVEFYNDHAEQAGKKFQIVFVSSDNDEDSFDEYMTGDKMPWPAIKFRYAKKVSEVSKYAGNGIPCLVLVDREGNVLSDSYVSGNYVGPTKVMADLEKLLKE